MNEGKLDRLLPIGRKPSSYSYSIYMLFAFFLALPGISEAVEHLPLDKSMKGEFIGRYVEHYEDKTRNLTIKEITSPEQLQKFTPVNKETLDFGQSSSAHWVTFLVNNPFAEKLEWVLEAEHPLLDHIEIYEDRGGENKIHIGGDRVPFGTREMDYRKNAFTMSTPPGEHRIFVKMYPEFKAAMNCSLTVWSPKEFAGKNNREFFLFGLFYGAMIVMVLYNLFVFISVRDISYFYYVCFLALMTWSYFALNGLGFQYLWPNSLWLQNTGIVLLAGITYVIAAIFTQSFLETKKNMPRMDKLFGVFSLSSG